jgi:hypothetical protein
VNGDYVCLTRLLSAASALLGVFALNELAETAMPVGRPIDLLRRKRDWLGGGTL